MHWLEKAFEILERKENETEREKARQERERVRTEKKTFLAHQKMLASSLTCKSNILCDGMFWHKGHLIKHLSEQESVWYPHLLEWFQGAIRLKQLLSFRICWFWQDPLHYKTRILFSQMHELWHMVAGQCMYMCEWLIASYSSLRISKHWALKNTLRR